MNHGHGDTRKARGRRYGGREDIHTFAAYLTSRGYTVRDAGHARTHGPAAQRRRGTTLAGTPTRVRTCVRGTSERVTSRHEGEQSHAERES